MDYKSCILKLVSLMPFLFCFVNSFIKDSFRDLTYFGELYISFSFMKHVPKIPIKYFKQFLNFCYKQSVS